MASVEPAPQPPVAKAVVKSAGLGRILSLDGLRALSITLVMIFHLCGTRGFPIHDEDALPFDFGNFGVVVFFVISGYLITTLLLREHAQSETISLRRFYFRRTVRIFPTYYVYILVCVVLWRLAVVQLPLRDLLMAVTYTSNYIRPTPVLAHTWSLSVEEQFYLLWPAALLVLGRRRAIVGAAAFVLLAPVARVAAWRFGYHRMSAFPLVGDSIAVGCLLAAWRGALEAHPIYAALQRSRWFVLVPVALVAVLWARHWILLSHLFLQSTENLLIVVCLHWCLLHTDGVVGRILNARPLVFVGQLSYSLYLFQQLFLAPWRTSRLTVFPLNVVVAFVVAVLIHYAVEQPALRWRERFEKRRLTSPR